MWPGFCVLRLWASVVPTDMVVQKSWENLQLGREQGRGKPGPGTAAGQLVLVAEEPASVLCLWWLTPMCHFRETLALESKESAVQWARSKCPKHRGQPWGPVPALGTGGQASEELSGNSLVLN